MQIEITTPALKDLDELRKYSLSGLNNIISDIESVIRDIPVSVSRGRKTPRDDVWERIAPKYKFVIPYYIRGDTLYILRIYHTKRDKLDYTRIIDSIKE
jgi:plasmid stabilization system protein ParE